ncbi:unnamed protein product [Musa acuminata subsp. malaccensis]|uniref:(wild Malaysian banana) hypothetical protein n=1 Tax=Musa acuminata subsp. malaccensis TaxID=214687 RepID=A0A804JF52_MUSAM|nr:PREDICTED: STOREKEEPER protein-like [Musa acuminata subsp. malaccensis]CAG1845960.1 unnamed protein product [Musa acuminata subsp. malaccensis]
MPGDPPPDDPKDRRKRKAGGPAAENSPGAGSARSNPGQRRVVDDDSVALLRGVLEFRHRTGLLPTKSNMPAFYESVSRLLRAPLTKDQVYNKLRHLRHKFSQTAASGHGPHDGILHELAAKIWPADEEKMDKKEEDKKQQQENDTDDDEHEEQAESQDAEMEREDEHEEKEGRDEEEQRGGCESYPYLAHAAAEHWKAHSLSNASLEVGLKLLNPSKAKALEGKWKRLLDDEMKFQADWFKACRDIFALLNESHKGM